MNDALFMSAFAALSRTSINPRDRSDPNWEQHTSELSIHVPQFQLINLQCSQVKQIAVFVYNRATSD